MHISNRPITLSDERIFDQVTGMVT